MSSAVLSVARLFQNKRLKLTFLIASSLGLAGTAFGSTIAWNFTTADPSAISTPTDFTGGTVTQYNSFGTVTLLTTTSASSGYTGSSGTNNAGIAARVGALNEAASGSAAFQFTITPAATLTLDFSAVQFGARATGTGPKKYSVEYSYDAFATAGILFGNTIAEAANSTWALKSTTATGVTSTGAITFRIYGSDGTGSPTSGTANWRIDDLLLTYSTVGGGGPTSATYWDGNGATAGVGGDGTWSTSSTTFNTAADGSGTASTQAAGLLTFGGTTAGTVTVSGDVTADAGLTFNTTGYTISGGTSLTLSGANSAANPISTASSVTATIDTPMVGANGFTKSGNGTLVLSNANPGLSAGVTTISAGSLQIGNNAALGATTLTINGGSLASSSSSARTISNAVSLSGSAGFGSSGTGDLTISNPVTLSASQIVTVDNTLTTFAAGTTAVGAISKAGSGTLRFAGGTTSEIGALAITAGKVDIAAGTTVNSTSTATSSWGQGLSGAGALGIVLNAGGRIDLTSTADSTGFTGPVTLSGAITGSGGLYVMSTLSPLGTGPITIATDGFVIRNTGATAIGTLANPITLTTGNVNIGSVSGAVLNVGPISGNGGVNIRTGLAAGGAGTVTFTGASTFTGTMTIAASANGRVKVGATNALPTSMPLVMGNVAGEAGIFDLNGFDQELASISSGAGAGSITNSAVGPVTNTLKISGTTSTTYGFVIGNGTTSSTALTRAGSGTTTLTGVNTYTGATTVAGPTTGQGTTLALGQGGSLSPATAVSVAANSTFATTYTSSTNNITGGNSLSLASGAALNLGDGNANTLNFTGGASALSGGTMTFDFLSNTSFDVLALGSTTLSGTNTIAFNGTPTLALGTYSLITGTFNTGTFFTGPASLGGFTLSYNNTGSTIDLVVSSSGGGGTVALGAVAANGGAFGNVLLGSTVSTTVTLTNSGTAATTDVTGVAVPGFTIGVPVSQVIAASGGTTTSTVTVDTSTSGPKSGNLTYTANPGAVVSTPVIALSANVNTATYGTAMSASTPNGYTTPAGGLSSSGNGTAGAGAPPALHSTATILSYTNSTGTDNSVSMNWRTRTADEASNISGLNDNGNKAGGYLISDVLNLTGMINSAGTKTDNFVLQMNYNEALLNGQEASFAATNVLYLASLSGSTWVNATDLNIAPDTGSTINNYSNDFDTTGPNAAGSWANFVAQYNVTPATLGNFIGSWGVDQTNNQVWAILDHNSEFAVIPEPSTMVFGGIALLGFAGIGLRRRRLQALSTSN